MSSEGHVVVVDFTVTEFQDGEEVNQVKGRMKGNQPYVPLVGRLTAALGHVDAVPAADGVHQWRQWAGYENDKPKGVKDPCGGCGKAKTEHPMAVT